MIQLQKETAYLPPSCSLLRETVVKFYHNTILQYKFYCLLPMGAFQRQVLIVQVIKNNNNI